MSFLRRIALRLRAVLGRRRLAREMDQEMREHLELATERCMARGLSLADARAAARREFGNLPMIEDAAREARGARWVDELAGDMRFAFRYFGRHKAITAIIVVVLALGTGANTLIFSMVQAEFLRPAPGVPDDDALARLWVRERSTPTAPWRPREFTLPELEALARRRDVFVDVAGWYAHDVVLQGGDSIGASGVGAQFVTPNFFRVLGVSLAAGVGFVNTDETLSPTADPTAIMSHTMAIQLYGSAAGAMGRDVLVNEVSLRVVGVAPPRFQGALRNMDEPALWIPAGVRADIARVSPRWLTEQAAISLVARLAPGVTHAEASVHAHLVITNTLPDSAARVGMARMAQVLPMHEVPRGGEERDDMILAVSVVMTIGALILLVAWMNVSSLMVAAAVGRRHEIAVRLSLGASRARLLRQLVTESTLLALSGAAIGLLLAWWMLVWEMKVEVSGVDLSPDAGTFVFVLAMAVSTGILFGLSPALHATRNAVAGMLRDPGMGTSARARLQRGFVVAQVTLSQPLLVVLGTMLAAVIGGYRPNAPEMARHVVAVGLRPLMRTGGPGQRQDMVDSLVSRIADHPEVVAVAPDVRGIDAGWVVTPDLRTSRATTDSMRAIVNLVAAAPGWLAAVDVPIMLGRDVSLADTAGPTSLPVVIGSDLARALWGDVSPIGRTVSSPVLRSMDSTEMTVIGVYDATQHLPGTTWSGAGRSDERFRVYTARGKEWRRDRILVRTRLPAESFIPELRQVLRDRAPSLPVSSARTLAQLDAEAFRETLRASSRAGFGGLLALLLASLGLYGVVSLAVRQRTREIGIRIAVGASSMQVTRMFLGSGVRLSVIGLLLGLPLSIAGLRVALTQGLLVGAEVNAWAIGLGIAVILLAVAVAATWMPARRAALVDPAMTLRVE